MKKRIRFVFFWPGVVLGLLVTAIGPSACTASKPRFSRCPIILISLDTVRADHLSCYGYHRDTSPAIDKIAAEGALFSNAFTPMPTTLPAHVSLFTSLYPREHQVLQNGWKIKTPFPILAEVLQEADYSTGAVLGAAVLKRQTGLALGFDYYDDAFDSYTPLNEALFGKSRLLRRTADQVVTAAEKWIDRQDPDRPFFMFMHFFDAHTKYDLVPDAYQRRFPTDPELTRIMQSRNQNPAFTEMINQYDGGIRFIDDNLAEFRRFLERKGLFDKCLILIVSDHGEGLGEHQYYHHGLQLYEAQVHVPFIIRFPQQKWEGRKLESLTTLLDAAPTILECVGLEPLPGARGKSVMPLIEGRSEKVRDFVLLERRWFPPENPQGFRDWEPGEKYGIRGERWKYIWRAESAAQLFDLMVDSHELDDRASAEPAVSAQMEIQLRKYRAALKNRKTKKQEVDPKRLEELKALGYVH